MLGFARQNRLWILTATASLALAAVLLVRRLPATAARTPHSAAALPARRAAVALPPIRHVWVIVLENESASTTFGPDAPAPYLAKTLPSMGLYLPNYYAIGHASLDNYIGMISGQPPNPLTQTDCVADYANFTGTVVNGIADGIGCVYPTSVPSIADQLNTAGLTWKEYAESMPSSCSHAVLGQPDPQQGETTGDPYTPRHNPFVYFHSIVDNASYCDAHDVNLNALPGDLASTVSTPNYSFITPDVCGDGHDSTCNADPPRPGGFAGINGFLQTWVPKIIGSPAYKNGLLMITFDEADTSDASSCCGEQPGATQPLPGLAGPGGGDVGAVLLSPYIKPGSVSKQDYNHYSMLASIESLFGLAHIGMAALPGLPTFGSDVFNRTPPSTPACRASRRLVIHVPAHLSRVRVRLRGARAGHRTRIRRGLRPRVTITLKGRIAEKVTVTVRARHPNGHRYRLVRRFNVCQAA